MGKEIEPLLRDMIGPLAGDAPTHRPNTWDWRREGQQRSTGLSGLLAGPRISSYWPKPWPVCQSNASLVISALLWLPHPLLLPRAPGQVYVCVCLARKRIMPLPRCLSAIRPRSLAVPDYRAGIKSGRVRRTLQMQPWEKKEFALGGVLNVSSLIARTGHASPTTANVRVFFFSLPQTCDGSSVAHVPFSLRQIPHSSIVRNLKPWS